MPEVEIADLPLEVHGRTGFLDEYTHISGTGLTREEGLIETLSALLVSESCNVGLTPVADPAYPAADPGAVELGRAQLPALGHPRRGHRPAGRLPHPLPLAQPWGGGDMASADGMRFVIPVSSAPALKASTRSRPPLG